MYTRTENIVWKTKTWIATISLALLSISAQSQIQRINWHKTLGGDSVCSLGFHSIQFLSEDEILLLAGPRSDCYRSVSEVGLFIVRTDGRVLAHKAWPSTFVPIVISVGRFAVLGPHAVYILDHRLSELQIIPFPAGSLWPRQLGSAGFGELWIQGSKQTLHCAGNPLRCVEDKSGAIRAAINTGNTEQLVHDFQDGRRLVKCDRALFEISAEQNSRKLADLSWVIPCEKYCQGYEAGTDWQVAATNQNSILFVSNGSRFPITDAAGLFPYFRVEVFDLADGHEVYREQDVTRTGQLSASISPNGTLLIISDKQTAIVHKLTP